MQITETHSDGLKREFKVIISASDIDQKIDGKLTEIRAQANVPGFRPGKVPLTILKQRYGDRVKGEILEQAVNDSSSQALNERGLRPATQPEIEILAFDEGSDLEYSMKLELLPDIQPMDFSKLELEQMKVSIPDDEVEEALTRLASNQKKTQPIEKPRKAKSGDVLVIDFRGSVNGEEFPGMAGEDHHLELGSNSFIAGFEDQLVGAEAGEAREVNVTFPEEYVNDKLAGQDAVFQCTVKEIRESVPVPVDEELATAMGVESLDVLRDRVREQMTSELNTMTRAHMKRDLLDKLADGHEFPVPDQMVDLEFETIWKQVEEEREKGNVDPDDEGKGEDDLKGEYRDIARRRVSLGLLLSEVGRINGIEVTQDEVNKAMLQEAQRYPGQEQQVFQFFQSNPQALAQLRAPLFEDKVVDFIVDLAQVTEREVTPEELRTESAGEEGEAQVPAKKASAKKTAAKKTAAKKAASAKKSSAKDD